MQLPNNLAHEASAERAEEVVRFREVAAGGFIAHRTEGDYIYSLYQSKLGGVVALRMSALTGAAVNIPVSDIPAQILVEMQRDASEVLRDIRNAI
jgi:hypothetical protein